MRGGPFIEGAAAAAGSPTHLLALRCARAAEAEADVGDLGGC
jgi:hypothetical protein